MLEKTSGAPLPRAKKVTPATSYVSLSCGRFVVVLFVGGWRGVGRGRGMERYDDSSQAAAAPEAAAAAAHDPRGGCMYT
jgi:hypothetical protein